MTGREQEVVMLCDVARKLISMHAWESLDEFFIKRTADVRYDRYLPEVS